MKATHFSAARFVAAVISSAERVFPTAVLWFRMPAFVSWTAVSAGVLIAFSVPWRVLHVQAPAGTAYVCAAAAVGLAGAGVLTRRTLIRFCAFLICAVILCTMHRGRQVAVYDSLRNSIDSRIPVDLRGTVTSPPMPCYENFHFLLKIDSADPGREKLRGLTVNCVTSREPPRYGRVKVRGILEPPGPRRNPYEYDEYLSMMARGVWGTFHAGRCEVAAGRESWLNRLSTLFRGVALSTLRKVRDYDNRALLQASFLGDTECLSPFLKTTFRKSGIYHLIAISGLNTAMLVAALYFFLRLFPLGRVAQHVICIAALWLYLPFVGMIPSLFRATVMTTFVIAAVLIQKKNYAVQTLGLAGTVWLILSPESLFEPGYQLSFAATAGLLLLFPVLNRLAPRAGNRFVRKGITFVFSSIFISLASFFATLPVLLYHFGTLSFFGIIANLVAVSTMTISMWAFFAGLFCEMVFPPLTALPLWVSERFMDIVVATGRSAGFFSWSQMTFPTPPPELFALFSLFLIGVAAVRQEFLARFCIAGLAFACLFVPADLLAHRSMKNAEAVRFAVQNGPLLAIRWPDARVWLFCGSAKPAGLNQVGMHVLPWLRHRCGNRVDALFVPAAGLDCAIAYAKSVPAMASAAILPIPGAPKPPQARDSLPARFTPCPGCSCSVMPRNEGIAVGLAAAGADTLLPFTSGESILFRGKRAGPAAEGNATALIFRNKTIRVSCVLPPGHPLAPE